MHSTRPSWLIIVWIPIYIGLRISPVSFLTLNQLPIAFCLVLPTVNRTGLTKLGFNCYSLWETKMESGNFADTLLRCGELRKKMFHVRHNSAFLLKRRGILVQLHTKFSLNYILSLIGQMARWQKSNFHLNACMKETELSQMSTCICRKKVDTDISNKILMII